MSICVRCFSPWLRSKMRSGMLTLRPSVWSRFGLLFDGFYVYQALKVGSVDPLAIASLWLVSAC